MDFVERIIAYEAGELSAEDTLALFSELVRTGQAWTLQGHYGRTARTLIVAGYLSESGDVLRGVEE